jgi:hypothetical protein
MPFAFAQLVRTSRKIRAFQIRGNPRLLGSSLLLRAIKGKFAPLPGVFNFEVTGVTPPTEGQFSPHAHDGFENSTYFAYHSVQTIPQILRATLALVHVVCNAKAKGRSAPCVSRSCPFVNHISSVSAGTK